MKSHLFVVLWWRRRGRGQLAAVLLLILPLLLLLVVAGHLHHPALHLLQPLENGHPELIICRKRTRRVKPCHPSSIVTDAALRGDFLHCRALAWRNKTLQYL